MTIEELYKMAIRKFGAEAQERQAVEECAELITAISHKQRDREHNIEEEIADVEIMLEQLKIINNCHDKVKSIKSFKIKRLYNRVFNVRSDTEWVKQLTYGTMTTTGGSIVWFGVYTGKHEWSNNNG